MSAPSLSYRLRSLWRRIAERLNWNVRVPLLFIVSVKNWAPYFSGLSDKRDITYRLWNGMKMTVPAGTTNVNPYIDVWMNGVYDHPAIDWKNARTIIDLGAHIGAFSLYAAKKSPSAHIIAFEPDPVTHAYLKMNVQNNNLSDRIDARQSAVSGNEGTIVLNVMPGRSEANSVYRSLEGSHAVTVATTTLGKIFSDAHIEHCDILKMNAEGVEYEILYGLTAEQLKKISVIVMNFHLFVKQPRATPEDLRKFLETNGFTVTEQAKRIYVATR